MRHGSSCGCPDCISFHPSRFKNVGRPVVPKVEPPASAGGIPSITGMCVTDRYDEQQLAFHVEGLQDGAEAVSPDPKPSEDFLAGQRDMLHQLLTNPQLVVDDGFRKALLEHGWVKVMSVNSEGTAKPVASPRIVIEIERETDGRWIADIPAIPGVMAYGGSRLEAVAKALTLRDEVVLGNLAQTDRK